jgi:serine/threonine-protein kinase
MVQVTLTPVQNALPSYEVGGELGRGAMGVVLAGHHRQLERDVAIKQLPAAFAADEDVRHRFGQEARTLAALAHPHIVPVYDYVEREGLCLLVMEALPGGTLWDRFTGEGITMATACAAVLATCAGLHFAHERGVLHRDVKPENLMFAADRTLKITDFGIAQVFGGEETVTTVDGSVIGTPAYMAPEQAEGSACGPPADVYATGTVLYELLSGALPFSLDGGSFEVLERRVHEEPQQLLEVAPNVPIPLAEVTMRAIARDPGDRYHSAEAFGVALAEAATESFGAGWLGQSDLTLVAPGPITIAAGPATQTGGTGGIAGAAPTATGRETMIAGQGAPVPLDPPLRMRATAVHRGGVRIDELRPEDLVRVDDLIKPPKPPRLAFALAGLLTALLVALSIVGIGDAEPAANRLRPGTVRVAGVDITTDRTVDVNLSDDVPVRLTNLPAGTEDARYVRLGFSALGIQLPPSRSAELRPDGNGGFRAAIDAQRVRILVSGKVTGELRFLDRNKEELRSAEFRLDADRAAVLAANGIFGLLILAFVITYGWSLSLPLRRGRQRTSAFVGMGILGGVAGAAVVDVIWALGGPQVTWPTLIVGIVLGIGAFLSLARGVLVAGRRRRLALARSRKGMPEDLEPVVAGVPAAPARVHAADGGTPAAHETRISGGKASGTAATHETRISGGKAPGTAAAHETRISGGKAPETPEVRETRISGGKAPDTPEARETRISGGKAPDTPEARETRISGGKAPDTPEARETRISGGKTPADANDDAPADDAPDTGSPDTGSPDTGSGD